MAVIAKKIAAFWQRSSRQSAMMRTPPPSNTDRTAHAIANASAWTLGRRTIPAIGLAGCLLLAFLLPAPSVLAGGGVVLVGAVAYFLRR